MSIIPLAFNTKLYTCSAYLITSNHDLSGKYNTLIDIGSDDYISKEIIAITANKYQQPVGQVILTHDHSDHSGGLAGIIKEFNPQIYAYTNIPGVSRTLKEGELIQAGENIFQVLHTPGHSVDSICLYSDATGDLFVGDIPLKDVPGDSAYPYGLLTSLEKLCRLEIKTIYPGHGRPLSSGCMELLQQNLANVKSSRLY